MNLPNDPTNVQGTRANRPDLDWSQIGETVLILQLSASQIMAAMRDSDSSVDVLANTFSSMAGYIRHMSELVQEIPTTPENASRKLALSGISEQVGSMINQAVISFQFYDKLVQRLSHVTHGLADITALVGDKSRLYSPDEWVALQERYRAKFSTAEERALFQSVVIDGMPVERALETYLDSLRDKGDDVELF